MGHFGFLESFYEAGKLKVPSRARSPDKRRVLASGEGWRIKRIGMSRHKCGSLSLVVFEAAGILGEPAPYSLQSRKGLCFMELPDDPGCLASEFKV